VGGGAGIGLAALFVDAYRWSRVAPLPVSGSAERIGSAVFQTWVLPFEVLSVLLLAALIGAIVVSRPDVSRPEVSRPDVSRPDANRSES
jgi:NADH-quinone oxidoreductase subunit J/NAD(P)H-quinone oxidoreductase subunit 6